MTVMNDTRFMHMALRLARKGLGRVWPNPAVGCVVVKEGVILGYGVTAPGGRPHAETLALNMAGKASQGATAYVTLEPCAHQGKTPPCTTALIKAGITRVVVATHDPFPQVDGEGIKQLKKAGIEVTLGVCEAEAKQVNAGFLKVQAKGLPYVTLKMAASLDGRIASANGESQWISGEVARAYAHSLRAQHDAIVVGGGTVRADDPALTCRLPGMLDHSPVRVVISHSLASITPKLQLFKTIKIAPVWIFTGKEAARSAAAKALQKAGAKIFAVASQGKRVQCKAALQYLAGEGITRVLVEGGGTLAASLLEGGLVDEVQWAVCPMLLGAEGTPAVASLAHKGLKDAPQFKIVSSRRMGEDVVVKMVRI